MVLRAIRVALEAFGLSRARSPQCIVAVGPVHAGRPTSAGGTSDENRKRAADALGLGLRTLDEKLEPDGIT